MASKSNTAALAYTAATADWGTITYVSFFTAATGASATTYLGSTALSAAIVVNTGTVVQFDADALSVTFTETSLSSTGATRAVDGFIAGTLYVALHTGVPGANGASNEVSGGAYARAAIAAAGWS